jgi:WXG100 family type VII secretion target
VTRVVVDLHRLGALVERMALVHAQLARIHDDVDARVRQLHPDWAGMAADTQRAAHAEWSAAAQQVHEALRELRAIAATARDNYHAAVLANRRMWTAP